MSNDKNSENLLIENQALQEKIFDFEKLSKVVKTICSTLEIDGILNRIISEALSLCKADQGTIILFDPYSEQITKTLIRSSRQAGERLDRHLNNILSGWVLEHKKTLISSDLTETFDPKLIKPQHRGISSAMSIPLELHGKIIGVINLITSNKEKDFGKREAWLMETLASQCAHFIVNARLHEKLFAETRRLKQELQDKYSYHGILGHSPAMKELFSILEKIIPTDGRVIVEGESGTGKELIARVMHFNGSRRNKPFVAVDCGALPANLLESELFGYVKGAFTGATQDKRGLFEEAHEGTLFLDEISNMPLEVQSKLLRSLEEEEIRPVGSTKVKKINVRIIAA
ncbi:GAF domain-containing protein, partial [Candidatus Saccharibacteria bacterium]|nr:GAF domain-containing protein [Candidatus Saccharibacteria bacterium]NIV99666.1 GAF domain-containing protein [Candidatus Saccharibacteria bacterium]NIW79068.1 GAF domain-containing protein [Calditrichia bacterium]